AEDGIRDFHVTGVQTCALPILLPRLRGAPRRARGTARAARARTLAGAPRPAPAEQEPARAAGASGRGGARGRGRGDDARPDRTEIGRASCRERVWRAAGA